MTNPAMTVYESILGRRSVRKFKRLPLRRESIMKWINAARLAPQGLNLQPVKYMVVDDPALVDRVLSTTKWAGYLPPEQRPKPEEGPAAYVALLIDQRIKNLKYDTDAGACGENLILCAHADGVGSCWLGALDRDALREMLNIPDFCIIHSLIALGYPDENPVCEDMKSDDVRYYRNGAGTLCVPKRPLSEIVFFNGR